MYVMHENQLLWTDEKKRKKIRNLPPKIGQGYIGYIGGGFSENLVYVSYIMFSGSLITNLRSFFFLVGFYPWLGGGQSFQS